MYKTKLTRKGQLTIPKEIRKELDLSLGDTMIVKTASGKIIIEEPKKDIMKLFGKWKWFDKKIEKEIESVWRSWNAENMLGH